MPKGPWFNHKDKHLFQNFLVSLKKYIRSFGNCLLKIEPEILASEKDLITTLENENFSLADYHPQFKSTMILDLSPPLEEIISNFKSKTRYNIRLAKRKGVEIKTPQSLTSLKRFYQTFKETGEIKGFRVQPFAYYKEIWQTLLEKEKAIFFEAWHKNDFLAGTLIYKFGTKGWYMYGADNGKKRNLMANYLLQWRAIKWLKEKNCLSYDLVGIPTIKQGEIKKRKNMQGVYRFKRGFKGEEREYAGCYQWLSHSSIAPFLLFSLKIYRKILWKTKKEIFF